MSDWYQIENNSFIVQVNSLGAEMKRLFSREWNRELLWLGDEKIWKRSAPILFPIVGGLKNGQYLLGGKIYELSQHGFARDFNFKCLECGASEITFLLEASQESYKLFPFCFELKVSYRLDGKKIIISYFVKNVDRQSIYFSIGAHPAFETKNLQDYEIRFEKEEKEFYQLNNGLVDWSAPIQLDTSVLLPTKELFSNDALIFKKLKSSYVDLVNVKRSEIIRLNSGTPYFGIWGKGDVPFICLEPWCGVADEKLHDGRLERKRGIVELAEGREFVFSYSIETQLADRS